MGNFKHHLSHLSALWWHEAALWYFMKLFMDFFLGIRSFCFPPLKKAFSTIDVTSVFSWKPLFFKIPALHVGINARIFPLLSRWSRWKHKCYRAYVNKQSCFWSGRVSCCCCHGEALSPVSNDDGFVLLCQMCLTWCQRAQTCSNYINPEFLYLFSFSLFHFQFVIEQKRDNDLLSAERRFSVNTPWIVFNSGFPMISSSRWLCDSPDKDEPPLSFTCFFLAASTLGRLLDWQRQELLPIFLRKSIFPFTSIDWNVKKDFLKTCDFMMTVP